MKRALGTILAILCTAAATLVPAQAASAANDYGNLTAQWWQWVYAQEAVDVGGTNTNPLLDSTGAYATSLPISSAIAAAGIMAALARRKR